MKMQKQFNGGRIVFSTNDAGTIDIQKQKTKKKEKNLDINIIPYTKINSKWIIDLKCKAVKLIEENISENC